MKNKQEKKEEGKTRFVTRRRFAELCSIEGVEMPIATIHSDVKRLKVIEEEHDGHNVIDIDNPVNEKYIEQKKVFHEMQDTKLRRVADAQKREIELEKAREDLALKRIQRMKWEGKLIPADLAQLTMRTHLKEVKQQFHHAAEQICIDTARKLGANKSQVAEMRGDLVVVINHAIEKAAEGMAAQVKSIQDEYRDTK